MRYRFIQQHAACYRVGRMCALLGVSRAGYYAWCKRQPSSRARANQLLRGLIRLHHQQSRGNYGYRRIHAALQRQEVVCGKNRVARLMRQEGLRARSRRRRRRGTTQSRHHLPVAPNRLAQDFTSTAPNQKWVTDITYIGTGEGWLYLAVVLDLYARLVVGWAMAPYLDDRLTCRALEMALSTRRPATGLIHHSDRGKQYASSPYQTLLADHRAIPSMSRTGNVYDNAPVESFFATLKSELIHPASFNTRREARAAIFEFIELFYNRQRLHSALGYLPPATFDALSDPP